MNPNSACWITKALEDGISNISKINQCFQTDPLPLGIQQAPTGNAVDVHFEGCPW